MTDKQDRQIEILKILRDKRQSSISELMRDLQVSRPTILRDLEDLSRAHYPIYTQPGRGGGIFVMEGQEICIPVMQRKHEEFLRSLYSRLQPDEVAQMDEILSTYSHSKYL